jgi:hypothetical protein
MERSTARIVVERRACDALERGVPFRVIDSEGTVYNILVLDVLTYQPFSHVLIHPAHRESEVVPAIFERRFEELSFRRVGL